MSSTFHPELDESPLLDCEKHMLHQQLVDIAQSLITCGKFDLCYAANFILEQVQLGATGKSSEMAKRVFKYINKNKALAIRIDPANYRLPEITLMNNEDTDWIEEYPGAIEELDAKFPHPMGVE